MSDRARILVCGGRDFTDREAVFGALDRLHGEVFITAIIHGGARGADALAGRWAHENLVPEEIFEADWSANGKAAGPIRNQRMIAEGRPDMVVAFPGGKGTADMMRQASDAAIVVWRPMQVHKALLKPYPPLPGTPPAAPAA